jgi:hypothetical protein
MAFKLLLPAMGVNTDRAFNNGLGAWVWLGKVVVVLGNCMGVKIDRPLDTGPGLEVSSNELGCG